LLPLFDTKMRPAKDGSAIDWLMFMWVFIGALEFLRDGVLILVLKQRISWWIAVAVLLFSKRAIGCSHHSLK